jgi:hypothetical protein
MTERDGFVQGGDALVRGKKKVYVLAVLMYGRARTQARAVPGDVSWSCPGKEKELVRVSTRAEQGRKERELAKLARGRE